MLAATSEHLVPLIVFSRALKLQQLPFLFKQGVIAIVEPVLDDGALAISAPLQSLFVFKALLTVDGLALTLAVILIILHTPAIIEADTPVTDASSQLISHVQHRLQAIFLGRLLLLISFAEQFSLVLTDI